MLFFDPLYLVLTLPALLLSLWATARVRSVFHEYSRRATARGMTGAEAARHVLELGGAGEVEVEEVSGFLSDHYDPRTRVLRLSPDNYRGASIAAVGVACHEAGHALQHKAGYAPLGVRSALVPVASFGSHAWIFILMAGVLFNALALIKLAVLIFGAVVAFQMVTLPVEFDASRRAKLALAGHGILTPEELPGAARVLDAAAWTYIAAAATAVMQLLYFLIRFGLVGARRD
jgi:hypothetical protein